MESASAYFVAARRRAFGLERRISERTLNTAPPSMEDQCFPETRRTSKADTGTKSPFFSSTAGWISPTCPTGMLFERMDAARPSRYRVEERGVRTNGSFRRDESSQPSEAASLKLAEAWARTKAACTSV